MGKTIASEEVFLHLLDSKPTAGRDAGYKIRPNVLKSLAKCLQKCASFNMFFYILRFTSFTHIMLTFDAT